MTNTNQILTFIDPPSRTSDARARASTIFFRSLCNLRWKSLNIVEPPDNTIFWHKPNNQSKSNAYSKHMTEYSIIALKSDEQFKHPQRQKHTKSYVLSAQDPCETAPFKCQRMVCGHLRWHSQSNLLSMQIKNH